MPELPEVETVRRTLTPILGADIARVWGSGLPLRLGRPVDLARIQRVSRGARVEALRRWGKYLLIDLRDREDSLLVHLGMSGRLRIDPAAAPRAKHTHLAWTLADGRELRFSDPRRFGQVDLVRRGDERAHPALARLGIDPLSGALTGAFLHERARGRRRTLKAFLLDQHVIAGIGNIYASEALWQAKLHPTRTADRLTRPAADRLAAAVIEVLDRALNHGGTSLRDFVAADGASGDHAHYLWVYDRAGAPCPRPDCDGTIRRAVQHGRATFFCPRCQRR